MVFKQVGFTRYLVPFSLLFLSFLTPVRAIDSNTQMSKGTCIPLTDSACQIFGYQETLVPNLLYKGQQTGAGNEIFEHLLQILSKCSPYLKYFLCSYYLPECVNGHALLPCRSFCQKTRESCKSDYLKYRTQLPREFACESLPDEFCISEDYRFEGLTAEQLQIKLAKEYSINNHAINLETSRVLLSFVDEDASGTVTFDEYGELQKHVSALKRTFMNLDQRQQGTINVNEMERHLRNKGISLTKENLKAVWTRHSSNGVMKYSEFVACMTRVQALTDAFKKRTLSGLPCECKVASFTYEEFIKKTIL